MDSYLILLMAATSLTLLIGLYSYPLAKRLQILDTREPPDSRRNPCHGTPLIGGLMVVFPSLIVIMDIYVRVPSVEFLGMVASGAIFLLLGMVDDSRNLKPSTRMFISILTVSTVSLLIPELTLRSLTSDYLSAAIELGVFSIAFTTVCVVTLANAVNMADGKNGIVISMSIIWTGLFFLMGPSDIYPLLIFLLISLAITLYFNLHGRLFLGDSGSLSLGVLFGYIAIYSYNNALSNISAEIIALWFWIPVIDLVRLVIHRVAKGRSPMSGDREHFHHLLYSNMQPRIALLTYLSLIAGPGLIAVAMPSAAVPLIVFTTVVYAWLCFKSYRSLAQKRAVA